MTGKQRPGLHNEAPDRAPQSTSWPPKAGHPRLFRPAAAEAVDGRARPCHDGAGVAVSCSRSFVRRLRTTRGSRACRSRRRGGAGCCRPSSRGRRSSAGRNAADRRWPLNDICRWPAVQVMSLSSVPSICAGVKPLTKSSDFSIRAFASANDVASVAGKSGRVTAGQPARGVATEIGRLADLPRQREHVREQPVGQQCTPRRTSSPRHAPRPCRPRPPGRSSNLREDRHAGLEHRKRHEAVALLGCGCTDADQCCAPATAPARPPPR